jgi:hypothetical protein
MTDDDLVKMEQLAERDDRMATGALYVDLVDRIEELERILSSGPCEIAAHSNSLTEYMFHWEGRALDAEAKLAKALEALRRIANSQPRPMRSGGYEGHDVSNMQRTARATLAEIDGDKP